MSVSNYWKTCDEDGKTRTHLSRDGDSSICGHDLAGDDLVHSKPPTDLGRKSSITCELCLQIIDLVKHHLKS